MKLRDLLRISTLKHLSEFKKWGDRQFAAPSPRFIKRACLLRNGFADGTWIETGTYFGETTEFLSQNFPSVISIEPEEKLFALAQERFKSSATVKVLNGTSESILPHLLPTLGGTLNFWLDGHHSGGVTFKGPQDTPIVQELECIERNLLRFKAVAVLIDDIRCFGSDLDEYRDYPPLQVLVEWANRLGLSWHIEQDILVAKTRGKSP